MAMPTDDVGLWHFAGQVEAVLRQGLLRYQKYQTGRRSRRDRLDPPQGEQDGTQQEQLGGDAATTTLCLKESQQIVVELFLVRVGEAMGCTGIDFQRSVVNQFRR